MPPAPVADIVLAVLPKVMLLAALSVNEFPLLQATGALTAIVPAEPPLLPEFVVVTTMLLLASAVCRSVFRMFEVAEPLVGE